METSLIGEYIKKRREDLGLTQEQFSEGICTAATLSRLENNLQTPTRDRISALLQRLGLPGDRYFALLSKNEEEIASLRKEICADEIRFRRAAKEQRPKIRERAMEKLNALTELAEPDDLVIQQFILKTKAALGGPEGPYDFEVRLDMLMKAIRLTVPRFDLEEISLFRYSMAETTLINQIALCYSNAGQKRKAIDIYRQLLKYIEKNDQELAKFAGHYCLVAHNLAICLGTERNYKEAIEISEKGSQVCVEYGDYQFLPGFLAIMAECLYFTGEKEESAALYFQAYYTYKAFKDETNCAIIKQEVKKYLNLEPSY